MVKTADSFDAFVKGISAVTGIPEGTVRASLPAVSWSEFQRDAEKYLPKAVAKIESTTPCASVPISSLPRQEVEPQV